MSERRNYGLLPPILRTRKIMAITTNATRIMAVQNPALNIPPTTAQEVNKTVLIVRITARDS